MFTGVRTGASQLILHLVFLVLPLYLFSYQLHSVCPVNKSGFLPNFPLAAVKSHDLSSLVPVSDGHGQNSLVSREGMTVIYSSLQVKQCLSFLV